MIVLMLIGIMWNFRNKIPFCLFGGCEDEFKCQVDTERSNEEYLEAEQVNKYCQLCWSKNDNGDCPENVLCYVVETDYGVSDQVEYSTLFDYCEFSCDNLDSKTVFVQYDHFRQKVIVSC
jgi:hypothetical protein